MTLTAPSTYTPGGAAVSMTVTIPSSGGFELSALASNNSQAGSLTAGTGTQVSGADIFDTGHGTTWTFMWTPPASNVGNVTVYVAGGTHSVDYASTATITPAATTPDALTLDNTALTFTFDGTAPGNQSVQVTSSGAPLPITTTVAVTSPSGGTWLTATPAAGTTPVGLTVSANPAGLAAGTYMGTVTVNGTGASNNPQTVNVTFTLSTAGMTPCGYTILLQSWDRALVSGSCTGHYNDLGVGFCLRAKTTTK